MEVDLTSHQLSPALTIQQRYDPTVKADLFSTRLRSAFGVFLIDPIMSPSDVLAEGGDRWAGVIVTNGNHLRAAIPAAREIGASIFAHASIHGELVGAELIAVADKDRIGPDLEVIEIAGAAPGEIALHWSGEGGVLILGDALIHMGSQGFTFLPSKYCGNHKLMRRALRKLLDYSFERILFAHGTPIVSRARARLESLLDGSDSSSS